MTADTTPALTAEQALGVALSVASPHMVMDECQKAAPGMLAHLQAMGWTLARHVRETGCHHKPDCTHHCEEGHYTGDDMAMAEIGTGWPAKWEAALAESEALRKALGALVVAASPVLRTSFAGGTSPDTIGRRIESLRDAYEAAMETLLAPFIEAHNARIMEEAEATQP